MILGVILVGSVFIGLLLWEWINFVVVIGCVFVYGLGVIFWLVVVIFLFDLLVVEYGWCGYFCLIGVMYGVIGVKSLVKVNVVDCSCCDCCMDCYNVCLEL